MTTIDTVTQEPVVEQRQVWDLPVRVFHWTLVVAFVGAFVTNRLGISYFKYHVWCGYTVIVLVLFRIVWGLVGNSSREVPEFCVRSHRDFTLCVWIVTWPRDTICRP